MMNDSFWKWKELCSYALTIIIMVLLSFVVSGILSNLRAIAASNNIDDTALGSNDMLDKQNIAEVFDFGSGIFAAVLFALSLLAYKNLRAKRLLYVSFAFALFAIRVIVSRLNLFMPEIESSALELTLAVMGFAALALFFVAIVRREKIKTRAIGS